jgi:transketolase
MRAVHGSTVLYPADGTSTVKLVTAMCDLEGISYLRTTREKTPMLYGPDEEFPIGGSKTLRRSEEDRVTLVGAGITLIESLAAADALEAEGTHVRVIDLYSVKPVDAQTLREALIETGLIVTVEDHWPEGGIGDAVLDALASAGDIAGRIVKIAPREMPGSGSPQELRDWAGISASRIADRVRDELL